ncbi:LysR family transcriptional regulator [Frankia sp. QA3]|uniref:LysR family transcriptional regulator n=1 Tax=Frankia sp. QA3 TaxID=710111 RepID=UPI00030488FA
MDPQQLRTFVSVATAGSFSAAARELGYTQSAVSQQIAALEADLGVALLHRRPVTVTEAGARLLEHAGPLLLRLAAARTDVVRAAGAPSERLTVATHPLAADRLARVLADVLAGRPRLDVRVVVAGTAAVADGVARGEFDLGLAAGLAASSDPLRLPDVGPIRAVGVAADPVVVILPDGHPLARRTGLRLADLVDARWIDAPEVASGVADLRVVTGELRFRAQLRYDGADVGGLLALIAAGHGLGVLPRRLLAPGRLPGQAGVDDRHGASASDGDGSGTVRVDPVGVPLLGPALEFRTELLWAGQPGPAALAVAQALGG